MNAVSAQGRDGAIPPAPRAIAHREKNRLRLTHRRAPSSAGGEARGGRSRSPRSRASRLPTSTVARDSTTPSATPAATSAPARGRPPRKTTASATSVQAGPSPGREEAGQEHESAGACRDRSPGEERHPFHPDRRDAEAGRGGPGLTDRPQARTGPGNVKPEVETDEGRGRRAGRQERDPAESHRAERDRLRPGPAGHHAIRGARPQEKEVLKDEGHAERQRQAVHLAPGQPADERRQRGPEERAAEHGQREGRRPRPAESVAQNEEDVAADENELPVGEIHQASRWPG